MYVIPRERGIVRFYVQLDEVSPDARGRVERSKITPEMIISGARKILSPYTLSYKYCEWSTAYQIGRRLGKSYHKSNRVFLAGDAVHTHSPRGGQGMNLSIHDAFNLGWKIGLCVKGITHRSILETYESERRQVAQDLIEFDRLVGDPISGQRTPSGKKIDNIDGVEPARLGMLSAAFYGGFTVNYDKSILVDKNKDVRVEVAWTKDITNKIEVGMRFPSLQVVKQADASVWRFLQLLKSDGRFRIVLFAGNIKVSSHKSRVEEFCRLLEQDCSFLKRITPAGEPIDSIIELITLHLSPRKLTSIFDFPPLLRPFDEEKGWDYDKIFVDDETYHHGHGQAYRQSGVDPQQGAVVVVRPDQHIAYVGNIEDVKSLEQYFLSVLFDKSQNLFV
jgi:phenol 2-monooxygenase